MQEVENWNGKFRSQVPETRKLSLDLNAFLDPTRNCNWNSKKVDEEQLTEIEIQSSSK